MSKKLFQLEALGFFINSIFLGLCIYGFFFWPALRPHPTPPEMEADGGLTAAGGIVMVFLLYGIIYFFCLEIFHAFNWAMRPIDSKWFSGYTLFFTILTLLPLILYLSIWIFSLVGG